LRGEDEARLRLKLIALRFLAVKGRRPTAAGRTKYERLYVYSSVYPASRRSQELLPPAADKPPRGRPWGGRHLLGHGPQ
jgi:hypothetical protein